MLDDIDENVLVFGYWNLCFCNWVLKFVYLYLCIFICVFLFVHYANGPLCPNSNVTKTRVQGM